MHIEKDKAYLLRLTPFRESSALVDLLTVSHGKVRFMVKGLKSAKSQKKAILQPCQMLEISYSLKPSISAITNIELLQNELNPGVKQFMLYQYAHELLLNILPEQMEVEDIFHAYQQFLALLCKEAIHSALRTLEISLIEHFLGLPELHYCQDLREAVKADKQYYFYPEIGVFSAQQNSVGITVSGVALLSLGKIRDNRTDEAAAQLAQPLTTFLISKLIPHKKLKSRDVYQALKRYI